MDAWSVVPQLQICFAVFISSCPMESLIKVGIKKKNKTTHPKLFQSFKVWSNLKIN